LAREESTYYPWALVEHNGRPPSLLEKQVNRCPSEKGAGRKANVFNVRIIPNS
jgi:hypothetical protein